jgi:hypothetical protein
LLAQNIPDWTHEQNVAALAEAVRLANSFGLTGIHEARTPAAILPAYQQLDREGRLTAHAIADMETPRGLRDRSFDADSLDLLSKQYNSGHLHTRFAKIFLDGVPTASRTAVMIEPYQLDADFPEPTNGSLLVDPEALREDLTPPAMARFALPSTQSRRCAKPTARAACAMSWPTRGSSTPTICRALQL